VDLVRLGLGIRALRRRRGWRRRDLAAAAGVSQEMVSLIERGHGDRASFRVLARVAAALDARFSVQLRWRAGDLDRLLDADHAALSAVMAARLRADGWHARVEVTYASGRSAGSIDILAWHPARRALLVIEIKTEIPSAEATFRKLDEKGRVAVAVARERFGWAASTVSRLLVIEDTSTNRRRVRSAEALFASALPTARAEVRRWLRDPQRSLDGYLFLSPGNGGGGIQARGGRHRVRRQAASRNHPAVSVARDESVPSEDDGTADPTILVGYNHPGC
jgi:transcriptional regulator with XRE-family HTH domain